MPDATEPSQFFEFLDRCAAGTDIEQLIDEFRARVRAFGFRYSAGGSWYGIANNRITRFFFVDWPDEVKEWYARENMLLKDPLVFAARRRMTGFTFSDVFDQEPLLPEMRAVFDKVRKFGYVDGFAVPIHGPAGYQGLVSLLATEKLSLRTVDRSMLEMMCRTIHDRCRLTIGFGAFDSELPKLSSREIECMKWISEGKTDWEAGQLLGISKSTVHFHVENAKKKLGKSSRTETVAALVLHGII